MRLRVSAHAHTPFLGGASDGLVAELLGFHQFYPSSNPPEIAKGPAVLDAAISDSQVLSAKLVSYVVAMGADAQIFVLALEKNAFELFVPSSGELKKFRIISPEGFSEFYLEPIGRGVVATSKRLGPIERYDEVLKFSAFCRSGQAFLTLTGNRYSDPNPSVLIFLDGKKIGRTVLK